jgi:hypothetical protein
VPAPDYHFVTRWRVEATCGEVADLLGDPLALPRWWPSVYLDVEEIEPGDEGGLNRRVRMHTRGWLPYTLRWESVLRESRYPYGFTIEALGDFVGRGVWTFAQDGAFVDITYDWQVEARKPLLRTLTPILRPAFSGNHRWAMAQGEESLRLELQRRRATNAAAFHAVPPPPGPVTYAAAALVGGAALIGGTLAVLVWRASRPRKTGA